MRLTSLFAAAPRWLGLGGLALAACVPVPPPESIGRPPPPPDLPKGPVSFEFASLDEHSVSAPAFRGKPAVLAFVVSDTLAGQAEADVLEALATKKPTEAHYALVAVEPESRHELVQAFLKFFTDKSHAPLLGAMADKDTLLGQGPFGDVRGVTVVVLDASGSVVFRKTGLVTASDITRALNATPE